MPPEHKINNTTANPYKLDRLSLMREIYRALINTGRTYAAFEKAEVLPFVERLADRGEILDPMSGYGLLMSYCAKIGIKAYCIEFNAPQYLWQVLCHPVNSSLLSNTISKINDARKHWPKIHLRATASEDWFPEESKQQLRKLFKLVNLIVKKSCRDTSKVDELTLALLMPFAGRFSCSVPGNNSTQVKKGGICVFRGWEHDYLDYHHALGSYIQKIEEESKSKSHVLRLGDCRTIQLPAKRFSAMVTSPPYPNHRDFSSMFAPENDFLGWLNREKLISNFAQQNSIIGSNFVSGKSVPAVKCKSARRFLYAIEQFSGSKQAIYDNKVYYLPYFSNYFHDLEVAYKNIVPSLRQNFEGYIIVVDNTARNEVIPVAKSVVEIWHNLGFKSEIISKKETFHVGTKNPRARGFKAKHTEYTIKVWRR